jgi:PAS domain S-box-containing protein
MPDEKQSRESDESFPSAGDTTHDERRLAEERLREYEQAVEGLEEMIVVVDREYRYLLANRKFLAMRHMTREQVVGRFAYEVLEPGVFETVIKEKLDACFRGQAVRYEMKYTYPEIGQRDVLISYFPIYGVHGIDRAACIFHDITERKLAEAARERRTVPCDGRSSAGDDLDVGARQETHIFQPRLA